MLLTSPTHHTKHGQKHHSAFACTVGVIKTEVAASAYLPVCVLRLLLMARCHFVCELLPLPQRKRAADVTHAPHDTQHNKFIITPQPTADATPVTDQETFRLLARLPVCVLRPSLMARCRLRL
jgi:hypothetical protein